ncbi:MAG: hypothetical protein WC222_05635 [Parachlamydiales bacterium]|jgi:hypothetical protein
MSTLIINPSVADPSSVNGIYKSSKGHEYRLLFVFRKRQNISNLHLCECLEGCKGINHFVYKRRDKSKLKIATIGPSKSIFNLSDKQFNFLHNFFRDILKFESTCFDQLYEKLDAEFYIADKELLHSKIKFLIYPDESNFITHIPDPYYMLSSRLKDLISDKKVISYVGLFFRGITCDEDKKLLEEYTKWHHLTSETFMPTLLNDFSKKRRKTHSKKNKLSKKPAAAPLMQNQIVQNIQPIAQTETEKLLDGNPLSEIVDQNSHCFSDRTAPFQHLPFVEMSYKDDVNKSAPITADKFLSMFQEIHGMSYPKLDTSLQFSPSSPDSLDSKFEGDGAADASTTFLEWPTPFEF